MLGSAPDFFCTGVIAAVLKGEGTIPVVRKEWMIVMGGADRGGRF